MHCAFINLDLQLKRREALIQNFRLHAPPSWSLSRWSAADVAEVRRIGLVGKLPDSAKACLLSHSRLIQSHQGRGDPLMILEDDAQLGPSTCAAVEQILAAWGPRSGAADWDLLFTDVVVTQPETMVRLARQRQVLMHQRQVQLLDLKDLSFAGSTAYILNPHSAGRVRELLAAASESPAPLDTPYDLLLRHWIRQGRLRAFTAFPFLTTVAAGADESQIQPADATSADRVWNAFRRAMWIDRVDAQLQADLHHLQAEICDEESDRIGTIISACLARRIQWK